MEVADSSFVVASGYMNDDDNQHKAKQYLEDAITLYMKHRGPYHNSTIKAQVCLLVLVWFKLTSMPFHVGYPFAGRK